MITKALGVLDTKLKSMSDDDILATWEALRPGWDSESFWDKENDIAMTDWAEAIYSKKSRRGL